MSRARRVAQRLNPFRDPPWLCASCGYAMDACSGLDHGRKPKEGDLSLCMNCAAVYSRRSAAWQPVSEAELAAMAPPTQRELAKLRQAIRVAGLPDLTRRDGRA